MILKKKAAIPILTVFFLFGLLSSKNGEGHLVTRQGGYAFTHELSATKQNIRLNYSFTPAQAIEGRWIRSTLSESGEDKEFSVLQVNQRIHRWLNPSSQANLYVYAGGGVTREDRSHWEEGVAVLGVEFDWEDRTRYLLAGVENFFENRKKPLTTGKLRLGLSPYPAEVEEVDFWLIWEARYHSHAKKAELYQIMRFFYRRALVEMGASMKGHAFMTLMWHF